MVGARFSMLVAAVVTLGGSRIAEAHDVRGDVVLLEIGEHAVEAKVDVPLLTLALARGESIEQLLAEPRDQLGEAARTSIALTDHRGTAFTATVRGVTLADEPNGKVLRFAMRFTPPAGSSTRSFLISDELVLRTLVTDNVYVFVHETLVGTLHYQQRSLLVEVPAPERRLTAMAVIPFALLLAAATHLILKGRSI